MIALLLGLAAIVCPIPDASHTWHVPESLVANPDGGFVFTVVLIAGPGGLEEDYAYPEPGENTTGDSWIADGFCSELSEEGTDIGYDVRGSLIDPLQAGSYDVTIAACPGAGGYSMRWCATVEILPHIVPLDSTSMGCLKARFSH